MRRSLASFALLALAALAFACGGKVAFDGTDETGGTGGGSSSASSASSGGPNACANLIVSIAICCTKAKDTASKTVCSIALDQAQQQVAKLTESECQLAESKFACPF